MGTLAVNRKGKIIGAAQASYAGAHGVSTGTATDNITGNQGAATQYFFSTGRGGETHRFTRTFLHFDTSGIGAGVSGMSLELTGVTNADEAVFGIKHSAGSSEGEAIEGGDFDNIDRSNIYTQSTSWSTGAITMTFTAAGLADAIANDHFNIALLGKNDQDAAEEGPLASGGDISNGIAFNSTIQLSYTDAPSGYNNTVNSVADDEIAKINTVATANIGKVNTVA